MLREMLLCILFVGVLLAGCVTDQSPEKGTLQLTSSPSGAEIYLDSQYQGTTPSTIADVEVGSHSLEYRLNGYASWKSVVTVPAGTSNYYAELTARPAGQLPETTGTLSSLNPSKVTVQASRELMVVGDSIVFSGTCTGCTNIALSLFGPGYYSGGVVLDTVKTDSINAWSYTWNPGTKIQSGTFTIVAKDAAGVATDRKDFRVIGNGEVTVIPSKYAASPGDTVTLSGRCSTGAGNVRLVMYGPGRYSSGVDIGLMSVNADNSWSYRYKLESTMPTGVYTASVSDVPNTGSGSAQFTVGFAS